MKGAGGDEQDVIGFHRAVAGAHRRALDERQQVALHALAGDIAAARSGLGAGADLVDLVEEDDAGVLHHGAGLGDDPFLVEQLVAFLGHEQIVGFGHLHPAALHARGEGLAQQIGDVDHAHAAAAGHAGDVHGGHGRGGIGDFQLYLPVVQLTGAQFFHEAFARRGRGVLAHQGVQHALLGVGAGLFAHLLAQPFARQGDAGLHEIADDLLHVAAHIAHFGEAGGLDLQERRAGQGGQTAGDLGLADAGGADHEDVLGHHLLAQRAFQLLAPPAVAQSDGDGLFGFVLADDVPVETGDDFAGGQFGHARITLWQKSGLRRRIGRTVPGCMQVDEAGRI